MPPFPALEENRIFGEGTGDDLVVFDPAEVSPVEDTGGDLKFRPITRLSSGGARARDLFMRDHLSQAFPPTLKLDERELPGPEVPQGVGRNDHDQRKNHDHAEAQSTAGEPDKRI